MIQHAPACLVSIRRRPAWDLPLPRSTKTWMFLLKLTEPLDQHTHIELLPSTHAAGFLVANVMGLSIDMCRSSSNWKGIAQLLVYSSAVAVQNADVWLHTMIYTPKGWHCRLKKLSPGCYMVRQGPRSSDCLVQGLQQQQDQFVMHSSFWSLKGTEHPSLLSDERIHFA